MNRKNKLRNNSAPALMNKEWLTQNIVRILSKPFLIFSTHLIKSINIANK